MSQQLFDFLAVFFCVSVVMLFVNALWLYSKIGLIKSVFDVADATNAGIVVFKKRGGLIYANKLALRNIPIFQSENKRPKLKTFFDYLYDNAQTLSETVQRALSQTNYNLENVNFREFVSFDEGTVFLVSMKKIEKGNIVFLFSDVSSNKRREENILNLHNNNYQLLQAIEASTCGIIISDPNIENNPVIFVNNAVCGFLGLGKSEVLLGSWDAVLGAMGEEQSHKELFLAILNNESVVIEAKIEKNNETSWFAVKYNPVFNEVGRVELSICILTDITLLKQRENEVLQAQKLEALGQLAAGIAHDFNNILSIVDGYSAMAEKLLLTDVEKARDFINKISATSKRGAGLTQKMLTFSKHKVVSKNVICLQDVLSENKQLLTPLLDASIRFGMNLPDRQINVKATPDSMGQVLMNLCINARDAMPNGGTLFIDVSVPHISSIPGKIKNIIGAEKIACICVSDSGDGMDKKTQERIFDPFFSTKQQGKGTGLGLSVVYGLVKEMGGAIDVKSSLQKGTDISIYLPVSEEKISKKIVEVSTNQGSIRLDGYTAIVVEDEPDLLIAVSTILEDFGLKVYAASCGDEALVLQDGIEENIDILLTDIMMPGMNGVKLSELMVSLRPELKVIFMSGYPANGDMAPVEIPKNAFFAAKPVNYSNLAGLLKSVMLQENLTNIKVDDINNMQRWVSS